MINVVNRAIASRIRPIASPRANSPLLVSSAVAVASVRVRSLMFPPTIMAITKRGSHGSGPLEISRWVGGKLRSRIRQVAEKRPQQRSRPFYTDWVKALRGRKAPTVDPNDVLTVMRIIDAAKQSSKQHRMIKL